jgi:predicted nucleic acid-binding protein
VITLDTSGFWAVTNTSDPYYSAARAELEADRGPWLIPASILTEISWIIQARDKRGTAALKTLQDFLEDLASGEYTLDCGENDFPRIRQLVTRYADLGLDFADAAVIACAERNGSRVLTTDYRHFPAVARGEKSITVFPTQNPHV